MRFKPLPTGHYVLFESTNGNELVSNDPSGVESGAGGEDLFVRDTQLDVTTMVTVDQAGTDAGNGLNTWVPQGPDVSFAMSSDGSFVAFVSSSSNLVPNDQNGSQDLFERDLQTQTTALISVADPPATTGTLATYGSDDASVSANGRYIAFDSSSSQLVTNVPTGGAQIYVRDTQAETTVLVSIDLAGTGPANGVCQYPVISADGTMVLFMSNATNLVSNDPGGDEQLFVRNLQTGVTSLVSVNMDGTDGGNPTDGGEFYEQISANDRFVVFEDPSTNLVANDAIGGNQLFVRDLQLGVTTLVSVDTAGTNGGDVPVYLNAYFAEISADGRYVAFNSYSDNLVAGASNLTQNVFVRDLQTGVTTLVSAHLGNSQGPSVLESMTPDGRYVVFQSEADDLTPTSTLGSNVFVRDMQEGTTTLVNVGPGGASPPAGNGYGTSPQVISSDGRYIVYDGYPGAIYVRDMQTGVTTTIGATPNASNGSNYMISADGSEVVFNSFSTSLVSQNVLDLNDDGEGNLFVYDRLTGVTKLVDVASNGTQSADAAPDEDFVLSSDGSDVVFITTAANLAGLASNPNGSNNVFEYSIAPAAPAGVLDVVASPIHAVAGTSFTGVVASFNDIAADPVGSYSALIDWADGSTSAGSIVVNNSGGFDVSGTHTFAAAGFYPIQITVTDSASGAMASASTTVVETKPEGDITYPIVLDTSSLDGTAGFLALQWNPGETPDAQPAIATVSDVVVTGGSLTSAVTHHGGASGSLDGTAQLTNNSVLDEIIQGLTFGSQIKFDLTISGSALETPGNGGFGSTFAAQLLAADGVTPQATIDPTGAAIAADVKPDGSTMVTNFPSSALGSAPVAGTPNVADAPLSALGTRIHGIAGVPFAGVIATFTYANPFGTVGDFTAVIDWGDHLSSDGVVAASAAGFQVTGQHTFAQQGTYSVNVSIVDKAGSTASATSTAAVSMSTGEPVATRLEVTSVLPSSIIGGVPFDVTVTAEDNQGNVVPSFDGNVTIALVNNGEGAVLDGTLTVRAVNGVATYVGLTVSQSGSHDTLQASSPGLVPAVTNSLDVCPSIAPTITRVLRYGYHMRPTTVVLSFDQALDAVTAQNTKDYRITGPAGGVYRIRSAIYDPATLTVTLHPFRRINLHHRYKLIVVGTDPGGLTSAQGQLLDGADNGQPGSNYRTTLISRGLADPPLKKSFKELKGVSRNEKTKAAPAPVLVHEAELFTGRFVFGQKSHHRLAGRRELHPGHSNRGP